jgi:hypothetical protein
LHKAKLRQTAYIEDIDYLHHADWISH